MSRTAPAMLRGAVMLLALVLAPAAAEACRCPVKLLSPQFVVEDADIILKGTVIAVERASDSRWTRNPTFLVERVWKGDEAAKRVQLRTGGCGPWVEVGQTHVVFARREKGALVADSCSHHEYALKLRSRSEYDALLPGHETDEERRFRLGRIAELEALYGGAKLLIDAGRAGEALLVLRHGWELILNDEAGRRLQRQAEDALARESERPVTLPPG